jgi:hypothetical protein
MKENQLNILDIKNCSLFNENGRITNNFYERKPIKYWTTKIAV